MKAPVLPTAQADRATLVASELKSAPSDNYFPVLWDRFPSKLTSLEQAPEPLRSAMDKRLSPEDNPRLIVFGPASILFKKRLPATLLVLRNKDWLLAEDAEDGSVNVTRCDFANTLLVELSVVLLRGELKIDFATAGRAQFVTAKFNTVMEECYQEAAQLLLDGMDHLPTPAGESGNNNALLGTLPLKLHNAILHYQPVGQRLLEIVRWPAAFAGRYRWLQHEIAPEAMLALTDRELLFISEEKSPASFRAKQQSKYGNIVTYCPLSRLTNIKLIEYELLDTFDLELRTAQGGEKLKIEFPRDKKAEVSALIERLKQRIHLHPA